MANLYQQYEFYSVLIWPHSRSCAFMCASKNVFIAKGGKIYYQNPNKKKIIQYFRVPMQCTSYTTANNQFINVNV